MPYKFETNKKKIPRKLKRSIKLTDAERQDIRDRHRNGESIRSISRGYAQVCRRTIQFAIFPERAKIANENSNAHRLEYPSSSLEKHRGYMKGHRRYKKSIEISLEE